jgi:xylulokinase
MLMYGSTMFVVQVVRAADHPRAALVDAGHGTGTPTLAAGMSTSGSLTDWLRRLVGDPPWEQLVAEAAAVPPGARGSCCCRTSAASGRRFTTRARGASSPASRSAIGRGELLRAAYERIACGVSEILAVFGRVARAANRLVAVGGGTRATLWTQIVSDVTGVEQHLPE